MYVPPMEIEGQKLEYNNEQEEEVYGDEKYGIFGNNETRHVQSEFMLLMINEKRDEEEQNDSDGEERESLMLPVENLYAWIMAVFECLRWEENRGGNRKKH